MRTDLRPWLLTALLLSQCPDLRAQSFRQTQTDDYTRYELLDPETQSFRIRYDVTATAAGARFYFNSIRVFVKGNRRGRQGRR